MSLHFFFLMIRHPPRSTLFPSTTLSRSQLETLDEPVGPGVGAADVPLVELHRRRLVLAIVGRPGLLVPPKRLLDRKSTRLNSSHSQISYAVFCLKKKNH